MKAKHVTEAQMEQALELTNKQYNNNITWNRFEAKGKQFLLH